MFIDPNEKNKIKKDEILKKKFHLNLKIEKLFINGIEKKEGILQANEVAFVVSQSVGLMENQIGFLFSKNKFDENGILTICSKLVHPDYKGRISAQFINIQQESISLRVGDSFLEMILYENKDSFSKFPAESEKTDKDYLEQIQERSKKYPRFFLDIKGIEDDILKKVNENNGWEFIKRYSVVVGIFSAIFSLAAFAFSIWMSSSIFQRTDKIISYINDYSSVESIEEIQTIKQKIQFLENELKYGKNK